MLGWGGQFWVKETKTNVFLAKWKTQVTWISTFTLHY